MELLVIDSGLSRLVFGDRGYEDVVGPYLSLVAGVGGDQRLEGLSGRANQIWGEAMELGGTAQGGNDTLLGAKGQVVPPGADSFNGFDTRNLLSGDAEKILDEARGGNDVLKAGARAFNILSGDGYDIGDSTDVAGRAQAGDDRLKGGHHGINLFFGDGYLLHGSPGQLARGGNDTLKGGTGAENTLIGDAEGAFHAICGDDRLIGGRGAQNRMIGDFLGFGFGPSELHAGNDTLVSGEGANDAMWGDAGPDAGPGSFIRGDNVFVFAPGGAQDTIHDFQQGHDRIDLRAWAAAGIHGLGDIATVLADAPGNRTILYFQASGADTVTVEGSSALTAGDFIFA